MTCRVVDQYYAHGMRYQSNFDTEDAVTCEFCTRRSNVFCLPVSSLRNNLQFLWDTHAKTTTHLQNVRQPSITSIFHRSTVPNDKSKTANYTDPTLASLCYGHFNMDDGEREVLMNCPNSAHSTFSVETTVRVLTDKHTGERLEFNGCFRHNDCCFVSPVVGSTFPGFTCTACRNLRSSNREFLRQVHKRELGMVSRRPLQHEHFDILVERARTYVLVHRSNKLEVLILQRKLLRAQRDDPMGIATEAANNSDLVQIMQQLQKARKAGKLPEQHMILQVFKDAVTAINIDPRGRRYSDATMSFLSHIEMTAGSSTANTVGKTLGVSS